mgnify:FL=1
MQGAKKKVRSVSYAKWGYVFIAPFFIVFALFQLYPLVSTIYYSFFEYFFKQGGLIQVAEHFCALPLGDRRHRLQTQLLGLMRAAP